MQCKFLSNGLAVAYDHVVKPCCVFVYNQHYKEQNTIDKTNLIHWHQQPVVSKLQQQLDQNIWPSSCYHCQNAEQLGRKDSMRLNGISAYSNYDLDDITLEIRPGSTCNFSCQTCWPEASSRVREHHAKAGLILESLDTRSMTSFEWLLPIRDRIRNIVLLGGEPFYDKSCKAFLQFIANNNFTNQLTIFTNGSVLDIEFIRSYQGKLTLVFSIDAIGKAAEYIRYGTNWDQVSANYQQALTFDNIETRVNITTSVYNVAYIPNLVSYLLDNWPSLVTWSDAIESTDFKRFSLSAIPVDHRSNLIGQLHNTVDQLHNAVIDFDQKHNAISAVQSLISNLSSTKFDTNNYDSFLSYVKLMDRSKNIAISDYCPELAAMFLAR